MERSGVDRVLAANRYMVLGTADMEGQPWVTPVFFARIDANRLCWVSSPDSRHSVNIVHRSAVGITIFDSTVEVGWAEAAYFDATAGQATTDEVGAAMQSLNSRLPIDKRLSGDDVRPHGPLVVYRADIQHRYVLVRGGNLDSRAAVDMTVEV